MPFRLYFDGKILRCDISGNLPNEEVAEMVRKLQQIEAGAPVVPDRIADLSECGAIGMTHEGLTALTNLRKALKFPNSFKSAIVAPRPEHQKIAQVFATLNDHPQITIRIFSDYEAAREWIAGE